MTANQIAYWNMQENKRSHQAQESEIARSNKAKENIEWGKLGETHRSNLVNENFNSINQTIQLKKLGEESRHNQAVEAETQRSNVAKETETNRSNLAKEAETNRSNLAKESETHRSNVAQEDLKRTGYVIDIEKSRMENSGANSRNALDNLTRIITGAGNVIGKLVK